MIVVKNLFDRLGFTSAERKIVLLLVGTFLVGGAIRIFRSTTGDAPSYDYSSADAEFQRLSSAHPLDSSRDRAVPAGGGDARQGNRPPDPSVSRRTPDIVDINSASKAELMGLPGIGEKIAERIIHYREENGSFTSVKDLLKVKGIGKKKLEQVAPFCKAGDG